MLFPKKRLFLRRIHLNEDLLKIIEDLKNLSPKEFQKLYEKAKSSQVTKMIEALFADEEA
jgi:ribosomal protein L19E